MQQMVQIGPMAEMRIRDVPNDVKKAFKLICVEEGVSMNEKIIMLVSEYLRKKGKLR